MLFRSLSVEEAVAELKRSSGSQFDSAVVGSLLKIIEAEELEGEIHH